MTVFPTTQGVVDVHALNLKMIRYLPLEEVITDPGDGHWDVWTNRWWTYVPGKGLAFYGKSPQCNSNESIARKVQEQVWPQAELRFMERVCLPHNCQDYYV
jgi:hypothetical protein